jgi:hypothetical protein
LKAMQFRYERLAELAGVFTEIEKVENRHNAKKVPGVISPSRDVSPKPHANRRRAKSAHHRHGREAG